MYHPPPPHPPHFGSHMHIYIPHDHSWHATALGSTTVCNMAGPLHKIQGHLPEQFRRRNTGTNTRRLSILSLYTYVYIYRCFSFVYLHGSDYGLCMYIYINLLRG